MCVVCVCVCVCVCVLYTLYKYGIWKMGCATNNQQPITNQQPTNKCKPISDLMNTNVIIMAKYEHTYILDILVIFMNCMCSGVIIPYSHLSLSLFSRQLTTDGLGKLRPVPTAPLPAGNTTLPPHTKYVCAHMHTHVLRGLCCCLCWMHTHTHTPCMHTHHMYAHTPHVCTHTTCTVCTHTTCTVCTHTTCTVCTHTHSMLGDYATAACVRMNSHNIWSHTACTYLVQLIGCIQMNVTLYVAMVQQLCPACTHPHCMCGRL